MQENKSLIKPLMVPKMYSDRCICLFVFCAFDSLMFCCICFIYLFIFWFIFFGGGHKTSNAPLNDVLEHLYITHLILYK